MIKYIESGDLFASHSKVLVNTVNCVGVMGKGVALEFKKRYPYCVPLYIKACKKGTLRPGGVLYVEHAVQGSLLGDGTSQNSALAYRPDIIHFATKRHWRGKSKIQWIDRGLRRLRDECVKRQIETLAMPPIGCGSGGLSWDDVRQLIEKYLDDTNTTIEVYQGSINACG